MKKIITLMAVAMIVVPAMAAGTNAGKKRMTVEEYQAAQQAQEDRRKELNSWMGLERTFKKGIPVKLDEFPSGPVAIGSSMCDEKYNRNPITITFGRASIVVDGKTIGLPTASVKMFWKGSVLETGEMAGESLGRFEDHLKTFVFSSNKLSFDLTKYENETIVGEMKFGTGQFGYNDRTCYFIVPTK
ncbi:MAG: hypothetical protein WCS77_01065 [Elusimicrobiaceae bacterium]